MGHLALWSLHHSDGCHGSTNHLIPKSPVVDFSYECFHSDGENIKVTQTTRFFFLIFFKGTHTPPVSEGIGLLVMGWEGTQEAMFLVDIFPKIGKVLKPLHLKLRVLGL